MPSCFEKHFTSEINDGINSFLETSHILGTEQSGFRKGYSTGHSTIHHAFALHCLIDVYLQRKKRLFCAFIDYKKAFDSVQRGLLWESSSISNWILMSCQPHRVTSGQSNSGHKQINISILFSHLYQPSVKSIYKTTLQT